jgi:hypothetical protein
MPDEIDTVSRFSDEVESGDIQINVEKGDVIFTKNLISSLFRSVPLKREMIL